MVGGLQRTGANGDADVGGDDRGSASRLVGLLRAEESHYRNINEAHRRHFEAMSVPLGGVGVAASTRPDVVEGLAPYHSALDIPIARLLAEDDATSLRAAATAAAPRGAAQPCDASTLRPHLRSR